MEQQVRYCTSSDGTRIAYAELGQGPPHVSVFTWASNLEMNWSDVQTRRWLEKAAGKRRLIRFDRRGIGLSQRDVSDVSLDAHVRDLSALVDYLQLESFALSGFADGAQVSIRYAAENPERVSRLVIWQPYAVGADLAAPQTIRALVTLIGENWSMARRTIANAVFPTGPVDMQKWMSNLLRESVTPEIAIAYLQEQLRSDVSSELTRVQTPTLVLQRRGDRFVPVTAARALAAEIPDARYVALEGDIGYVYFGETEHLAIIDDFLGNEEGAQTTAQAGPFRTVLFTDLVGHTQMMSRLGDEAGRVVLREHEDITRNVLKQHGGTEVKTMGDGFMASFGSVTKAVECAIALQQAIEERNSQLSTPNSQLTVRVGLNAGEPIEEDGDLFGATVILASRIAAKAEGGEILVSDNVRSLCSGKGFLFSDRGDFVPKGMEDPVRVYEVSWRS
jgi:class 3 adenylate cyclase/pimeloyl-ACP methyl ester carboxylesterase